MTDQDTLDKYDAELRERHRRWWNCWLRHRWTPWSDAQIGIRVVTVGWGPPRELPAIIQIRRCFLCFIEQRRSV